jgi:hypothetical protein
MSHFIKTGYWEESIKGYKGWLDLEQLIASVNPGGGVPTLTQVLQAGNFGDNVGMALAGEDTFFSLSFSKENSQYSGSSYTEGIISLTNNSFFFSTTLVASHQSLSTIYGRENVIFTCNFDDYSTSYDVSLFLAEANSNITVNHGANILSVYKNQIKTETQSSGSALDIDDIANIYIKQDQSNRATGSSISFDGQRWGIYIDILQSPNATYNNEAYGIYDYGNPIYFGGLLYVGTAANPATTNVAISVGKPINYQNSTTNTAGGASGEYLTVYVNGVQRKIALLNI